MKSGYSTTWNNDRNRKTRRCAAKWLARSSLEPCQDVGRVWRRHAPAPADEDCDAGCGWRQLAFHQIILVQGPVSCGRIVDVVGAAYAAPEVGRYGAVVHRHQGAVISQCSVGPFLQKPRKVFHPAAV